MHIFVFMNTSSVLFRIGNTDDLQRIYYYKHYINQVLKAIKEVEIKLS